MALILRHLLVGDGSVHDVEVTHLAVGQHRAAEPHGRGHDYLRYFEKSFGSVGPAFWVFAGVCLLILVFGWKMVPETKQRSLEEIAAWWQHPEPATSGK